MVAAATIGAGVAGAAGSMASGISQSSAMGKAQKAQQQQFAETKAALEKGNKEAQGYISPYAGVGQSALNELAYGMGLATPDAGYTSQYTQQGGLTDFNYGQDQYQKDVGYTPMVNSLADLQATPGYQFQLEQGLQGVNNSAAARGGLLSGANMKAINDYAQGQASTGYQNAWDRAQSAYQNAFNRNFNAKQQKFTNLKSMANSGQDAAQTQGGWAMDVGKSLAGASQSYGNNMSDLALGQGQINANMYTGLANAAGGMMSGLGSLKGSSGSSGIVPGGVNFNSNTSGYTGASGWPTQSIGN